MGKIITVASQKGGVGKTTTALNLAFGLSRLGGRTLIIDSDPQGGIAIASNLKKKTDRGLIDILKNECAPQDVVMYTRDGTLAVVGVGVLDPLDVVKLENEARRGNLGALVRALAEGFDYAIVDAPAGVGGIVTSMLGASDSVILAVHPRNLSLKTLPSFLKALKWTKRNFNPGLRLEGILLTMFDARNAAEAKALEEIKNVFPEEIFFKTAIPLDGRFEEASLRAVPVSMLPGGQEAARYYLDLTLELKERELFEKMKGDEDEDATGLF